MAAAAPYLMMKTEVTGDAAAVSPPSQLQVSGAGKAMKSHKKYLHDKESEEYKKRRERNNIAVRKSRDKSRVKSQDTMTRIDELKAENARLENKVKLLSKELSVLKDLFLARAEELPDPTTTFGLFTSGTASNKLPDPSNTEYETVVTEPDLEAGSMFPSSEITPEVGSTIEVSADGEVTGISNGNNTVQLSRLSSAGNQSRQIVISEPKGWIIRM